MASSRRCEGGEPDIRANRNETRNGTLPRRGAGAVAVDDGDGKPGHDSCNQRRGMGEHGQVSAEPGPAKPEPTPAHPLRRVIRWVVVALLAAAVVRVLLRLVGA